MMSKPMVNQISQLKLVESSLVKADLIRTCQMFKVIGQMLRIMASMAKLMELLRQIN